MRKPTTMLSDQSMLLLLLLLLLHLQSECQKGREKKATTREQFNKFLVVISCVVFEFKR